MIVDSPELVAILTSEPERELFLRLIPADEFPWQYSHRAGLHPVRRNALWPRPHSYTSTTTPTTPCPTDEVPILNSECLRIADQMRRAFNGDPWHGSPLRDLLAGVPAERAFARPVSSAHSIWELVLHIDLYVRVACEAIQGVPMPKLFGTERDWPAVTDDDATAWTGATSHLLQSGEQLAQAIEAFADQRLQDTVPGREYDFYYLFHGIVQHSLYHGGQIALLRGALPGS